MQNALWPKLIFRFLVSTAGPAGPFGPPRRRERERRESDEKKKKEGIEREIHKETLCQVGAVIETHFWRTLNSARDR